VTKQGIKIVFVNYKLKVIPKENKNLFDCLWPSLNEGVRAIHQSRPITTSLEVLYQNVENLCFENKGSLLYVSLKRMCEEHIINELPKLLAPIDDQIEYLKLISIHWQNHCSHMMMICQIFLPLDRGYVLNNPLILSIWDLGLELFKEHVVGNKIVQTRCTSGIITAIRNERDGDIIDRILLKNILSMLYKLEVGFYIFNKTFFTFQFQFKI
jgi:cullin 4